MLTDPSPSLQNSWLRSRVHGVNPTLANDPLLPSYLLAQYIEQKQQLLEQIEPTINKMFTWIRNSQATVLIADTAGYILASYGDPKFLDKADKVNLTKGACWAENIRGTNAIGTAIVEQKAVAVVGKDHYCRQNHVISCAASPIFDKNGNLSAIIDISSHHNLYHPSMLAMMDSTASLIEDWGLMNDLENQVIIVINIAGQDFPQALVALDADGMMIGANRAAHMLWDLQSRTDAAKGNAFPITDWSPLLRQAFTGQEQILNIITEERTLKLNARILIDRRKKSIANPSIKTLKSESPPQVPPTQWKTSYTFDQIQGYDEQLIKALDLARRSASTDYNIFISGETGTGKEMVGQSIHHASRRSGKPFIAINCGAISRNLWESELFGYEAGAFTGAKQAGQPGKFELANEGTLFLDEIAEMPLEMQAALLRVLQEHTTVRIGGVKPLNINVRIIAATHKDLRIEMEQGRFRSDLYYRLQGISIALPPLRGRGDILNLANHFLGNIARELNKEMLVISKEASCLLTAYAWPGNVRELQAILKQAAFLTNGNTISPEHLPAHLQISTPSPLPNRTEQIAQPSLQIFENQMIIDVLDKVNGNISEAARILGIGRSTLYRKLREMSLR